MANWISTSWWSPTIVVLGAVLLFTFVILHYRQSRRLGLLFVLAGLVLFAVGYFMEVIRQAYDVRELPNGMLELIPRPWKAVCESVIVLAHGCIFVGLLAEVFPWASMRLERIRSGFMGRV